MSKNYRIKKVNNLPALAEIYNKNTKQMIGLIIYDKMLRYQTGNQVQGEHFINNKNEDVIVITINDHFKKLFDTQPNIFEGLVMHEIGHLVNGDFTKDKNNDAIRGTAILNHNIDIKEIKADQFALEEIGKNRFIQFLEWSIKNRINLEDDFPQYKQMAIQEYENRINIIKGKSFR